MASRSCPLPRGAAQRLRARLRGVGATPDRRSLSPTNQKEWESRVMEGEETRKWSEEKE